ncbi:MAG: peptidoglycan glycosyltransferase, partial [Lachnospiraceae bacterium]|nr:peptidoglycan glycosyltransferase [Lachnospiraceae bacterium]
MLESGNRTFHRKKITIIFLLCAFVLLLLFFRLVYLMIAKADYYAAKAVELHERERSIKAARGRILDCNGNVIADNKTVCTISVIHSQIEDKEEVIAVLCRELGLSEEYVRARVEKFSAIERIKSNVDKETGDRIREYDLAGVKVDEDYKRYYPYGSLASKVLGFTGSDNQGIIGLEVIYDKYLEGERGTILTVTDARGIEVEAAGESRIEPVNGNDLHLSMDMNIQSYATQLAYQAMETKQADSVSIIVMNPQNGEILAMVNVPEFDLNSPYELSDEFLMGAGISSGDAVDNMTTEEMQELLNAMWRNGCINDT